MLAVPRTRASVTVIFALLGLLLFLAVVLPQLWVRWVFARHGRELTTLPGTGGELARHLLDRFEMDVVKVEETQRNRDHYDPSANAVRLGPENFHGKSLTAVAVAAHEVGHAIQFNRAEPVTHLRSRYLGAAHRLQRIGAGLLFTMPLLFAVFRVPHAMLLTGAVGVATMLVSVAMYAAILPEEFDASFSKALPILERGNYVDASELPAVRQILRAAALTYVAGALADILNLGRWLLLLRGMR
jgi:Zn-dependent membrane protease YugP